MHRPRGAQEVKWSERKWRKWGKDQGRYRNIGVLKSRNGENMKRISLLFLGECGWFEALKSRLNDKDYLEIEAKRMKFKELTSHSDKAEACKKIRLEKENKEN